VSYKWITLNFNNQEYEKIVLPIQHEKEYLKELKTMAGKSSNLMSSYILLNFIISPKFFWRRKCISK
jgi:hypothetical protein